MRTILKYFFEKDTKKRHKLITFLDFFWNQLKNFIEDTSYDKIYKMIIKNVIMIYYIKKICKHE